MCVRSPIRVHPLLVACSFLTVHLIVADHSLDYEIRSLTGEPNYKSVNLSWEMEVVPSNSSDEMHEIPKSFTVFYCELQHFGPHRCRSRNVAENSIEDTGYSTKQYSTKIDNLRMATKYSFHIKPNTKKKVQKITGRSDNRDNEVEPEFNSNEQTIVIPTKGFSAQATKCLPHASEIEVETGPYFAGKIAVDGGNCGIKGNPKSSMDKYVMRIDHATCGSIVKPDINTVETFITVQENLGIFTHSTRRFVVVCTFQSGIQTVRASFTVPGKGGVIPTADKDSDRNGRERQFRMVDKSSLVLKESSSEIYNDKDIPNAVSTIETIVQTSGGNETDSIPSTNVVMEENIDRISKYAKYARLIDGSYEVDESTEPRAYNYSNYTGLVIAAALTAIMVGLIVCVIQREIRRLKVKNGSLKQQIIRNP